MRKIILKLIAMLFKIQWLTAKQLFWVMYKSWIHFLVLVQYPQVTENARGNIKRKSWKFTLKIKSDQIRTCTWMLTRALFIIAEPSKQRRCPLRGEQTNELWCIQTMWYYSVLKRNDYQTIKRHGGILNASLSKSERSQCCLTVTYCVIPTLWHLGNGKTMETAKGSVVYWVWGNEGMHWWSTDDSQNSEMVLYDPVMVDPWHCTCVQNHTI